MDFSCLAGGLGWRFHFNAKKKVTKSQWQAEPAKYLPTVNTYLIMHGGEKAVKTILQKIHAILLKLLCDPAECNGAASQLIIKSLSDCNCVASFITLFI